MSASSDDVIKFWFEEIEQAQWWKKDDDFDQLIKQRFEVAHKQAATGELYAWRETSLGSLAEIILLDQFSRNIYRGTPDAFAQDSLALVLAQVAIAKGFDEELDGLQRSFMYMPFMHSESLMIHHEAEKLFANPNVASGFEHELKHKKIIERFGRYPHRNEILGRQSTPQEEVFLEQPGSGF